MPDLSGSYRQKTSWGYFKLAGIVREIEWDQVPPDSIDISGRVAGWGLSLSGNIKALSKDVIRLQAVYGHGVQNYFNDAPVDVGAEHNLDDRFRPLSGVALPIFGATTYLDHYWNPRVTTAIGWSMVNIKNSDGQLVDAFHNGQYATVNLLWTPVTNVMMGGEFQYGFRKNVADGWTFNDYRLEFSFKFSFSQHIGGKE